MSTTIFPGRVKRIHINKHVIASNRKHGKNDPPISVKQGKENYKTHKVEISGDCTVIHSPEKPLPCGAKVWIETWGKVTIHEGLET